MRERESGFRYTPTTCFETFPFPDVGGSRSPKESAALPSGHAAIGAAAKELDQLRQAWLNPPEWTREEVLEFPATVGGPWSRFVAANSELRTPNSELATARYPRLVPKDPDCAQKLAKRTLTNLYNERPTWLDLAHKKLDEAVFAAYGWVRGGRPDTDLTDEQILERLLKLNLAVTQRIAPVEDRKRP